MKKRYIGWFIVICMVYFVRVMFLDADSQPYLLNQIQPIDEMYYNEIAVNICNNGIGNTILHGTGSVTIPNAKCYLLPNIFTGIFLSIFGKNYYGLRCLNIILGFFGMMFIGRIINIICGKFEKKETLAFCGMSIYALDFNILMLTRSAVTIMPCIFAEIVLIWLAVKYADREKKQIFFLAFWSLLSFCMIYMGVSFFVLAVGLWTLILFLRSVVAKSDVRGIIVSYLSGNVAAVLVSEIFSLIFLREHIWSVVLGTFLGFGDTIKAKVGFLDHLQKWAYNATSFWMSNMFRYNPILLIVFVCAVVICLMYYRKEAAAVFLLLLTGSHWLQTTVLVNANESKSTISYGAVLIFSIYILWMFVYEHKWEKMSRTRYLLIFISSAAAAYCVRLSYRYVAHIFDLRTLRYNIWGIAAAAVVLCGAACFYKKGRKYIFYAAFVLFCINTGWLSLKYVYGNQTFDDKNMCVEVGKIAGDSYTIGGFPLGCALYNETKPVFGTYNRYTDHGMDFDYVDGMYRQLADEYEELYYIGYVKEIDRLNDVLLADTEYYFDEVRRFPRTYYAYTEHDVDMGIYVKRKR